MELFNAAFNKEIKLSIKIAKDHYENFPVLSILFDKETYQIVALIYKFARSADDIADSIELNSTTKLYHLNEIETNLKKALNGEDAEDFYKVLSHFITKRNLSRENFFNLLEAFRTDSIKDRWNTYEDILNYCKLSANPIGRLILELHNIRDANAIEYSDKICTALQLTNFYQDIRDDFKLRNRIYLSLKEMKNYEVDEKDFLKDNASENLKKLLSDKVAQAENMFNDGKKLLKYLPFKLRFHIKLTILGGLEILNKIKKQDYNTLSNRPSLNKIDYIKFLIKLFFK